MMMMMIIIIIIMYYRVVAPAVSSSSRLLGEHGSTCRITQQNLIDARNVNKSVTMSPSLLWRTRCSKSKFII